MMVRMQRPWLKAKARKGGSYTMDHEISFEPASCDSSNIPQARLAEFFELPY